MSNKLYHKQISNYWWNKIKVLFPQNKGKGRPILNPKIVLNAILWILKSGARWRDLPPHFGNWNSIYHTFRRWAKLGIFEKILQIVNKNNQNSKLIEMDSTYCKVHQSACSKLKNQEIGVSRGGKTTKIHALVNENFQLLNVMLTGGNVNDSECAVALLKPVHIAGKKILADRAYSSSFIRTFIEKQKATVCIPDKSNFKVKHDFDKELYKQRNIIERFFQRIKNYRHIAFRFDKLAVCFLNFVLLAASVIHF